MFAIPRFQSVDAHGRKTDVARLQILADRRMLFAKSDHIAEEFKEILIFVKLIPVQPRNRIVLTIRIVISESCVAEFIAGQEHGSSPAAHE